MISYTTRNNTLLVTLSHTPNTAVAEDMRTFATVLAELASQYSWECAPTIEWCESGESYYYIQWGINEIIIDYNMIYHFHLASGDLIGTFATTL